MQHHIQSQNNQPLSSVNNALARSRLYWLLGQLFHSGLTAELMPVVQAIDEFGIALPTDLNVSEQAAVYQQIFGLSLFAHESIFLDPSGMLGGSVAEMVMARYGQLGYQQSESAADGDHLGAELRLLSFLCAAEAEAWEDNRETIANRMRQAQANFLQDHLLRWVAPCLWAIQQEGNPFYDAVATVTWELVSEHYGEAATTLTAPTSPFSLPEPPDLLADPKTGLRDIAEFLMTPCYSGLFISRTTVGNLGRELQLPRGFTDRTTMLVNLMQSAAQYDGTLPLLDKLIARFEQARQWYDSCANDHDDIRFALQPWVQQTGQTVALLSAIKISASDILSNEPDSQEED